MVVPVPHPHCETSFEDPLDPGKRHAFGKLSEVASIDLTVVVPAYNEEHRLPTMLDEALGYLERRRHETLAAASSSSASKQQNGFSYEVIVVDDGSRDQTVDVATRYVQTYSTERVRVLRMRRNSGKGAAVRQGVLCARGTHILMADADAATTFEDVELLEHVIGDGIEVAIGSRAHLRSQSNLDQSSSSQSSKTISSSEKSNVKTVKSSAEANKSQGRDALRSFVSFIFNLLVLVVGGVSGIRDTQCGFKLYTRRAARVAFEGQRLARWAFDVENLYRVQKAHLSVVEVPVHWTEVPGSKLSVVKATINMAWDMFRMRFRYLTGSWALPSAHDHNV